jgi:hypothetical protein
MTGIGWVFMIGVWAAILGLFVFTLVKTLGNKD